MTASAAARRTSSGPGASGKPWPRLIALLSRASCDIASKIVTGRSAKTLFVEIMAAISRRSWLANPRPSRPAFRPRDACHRRGPPLAQPATPSPTACPSGRRKPPACHGGRGYPGGRNSTAGLRPRPDTRPRQPHSVRGHRREDSGPRLFPSIRLPASNREPDDPDPPLNPPNNDLAANASGKSGTDGSPFRAHVAPGVTKIKRQTAGEAPEQAARP